MATNYDLNGILEWRCIGPFRGGRVLSVAGDINQPNVFYFGACAGGVWKTEDAGTFWECISDGYFNTASIGSIAVSEVDPNVIYAGTGESTIRIDVSHGDGVYKSTDAGRTWAHIGLEDTRHIGKVLIHPQDPDTVFVAALGHAFGPNQQRGVFKSSDGGATWKHVLFKSEKAGAIDITIDENNPRILYAAIWEAYRNFWNISSGGPDSGLWKSVDGGETWTDISTNKGLPEGLLGKIGVAASPAKPGRVWAIIEAQKGGMYRSDDYGETWQYVSPDPQLISRAWYYMHVTADPVDGDTVFVNNLNLWKSTDGGCNYLQITTPHGDNHDIWIDRKNPNRMIQGNDGGANVSFNGGTSWTSQFNQPTAQFYHVAVDTQKPYRVYGTQQDNSSVSVPSRGPYMSITWEDCYVAGTAESGYVAVRPDDPNIVYVGAIGSSPGGGNALQRYDHRNKQIRLITTWPEAERGEGAAAYKYRFAWTYPILISHHDPNILYIGGNQVFMSNNEGQSWHPISDDLTVADPETLQPSGGPINRDAVGAEIYATVFALSESPLKPGLLWAGSDDGLVHITQDNGETWTNITPDDLPEKAMISFMDASPHDAGTAYMAATKYKLDDYAPYLYKTTDFGQTWTRINNGIRENDFTRVIREDPNKAGLLYAGTETGVYVSFDAGVSWQALQLNLPICPVHDLLVHEQDLVVATHGRSFWILDDVTALYQLYDDLYQQPVALLRPRDTERILPKLTEGRFRGESGAKNYMGMLGQVAPFQIERSPENAVSLKFLASGTNPPKAVVVTYHLAQDVADDQTLKLSFLDADGNVLHEFRNMTDADRKHQEDNPKQPPTLFATSKKGWNRFIWDMRVEDGTLLAANDPQAPPVEGPVIVPGSYQVQVSLGDVTQTQAFEVLPDPQASGTLADMQEQYDFLIEIRDKQSEANEAVNKMRKIRQQLGIWEERLAGSSNGLGELAQTASDLKEAVLSIEKRLMTPDTKPGWPDMVNHGSTLIPKLGALPFVVNAGDYRPTDQSRDVYAKLCGELDDLLAQFQALITGDLAAFNQRIIASEISVIGI